MSAPVQLTVNPANVWRTQTPGIRSEVVLAMRACPVGQVLWVVSFQS